MTTPQPRTMPAESTEGLTIEAQREPLVTYREGRASRQDLRPERRGTERATRFLAGVLRSAAVIASVLFLATVVLAREPLVRALPDLAGLYEAVGLGVRLMDLSIEDVHAQRLIEAGEPYFLVTGNIELATAATLPKLVAVLQDSTHRTIATIPLTVEMRDAEAPEKGAFFRGRSSYIPDEAVRVVVRPAGP